MFELETLPQKAERLKELCRQPLGVQWAHSAIEDLARDLFASSTDDRTTQAAAEVLRESAKSQRLGQPSSKLIGETRLGELIERLCECVASGFPAPGLSEDVRSHRSQ